MGIWEASGGKQTLIVAPDSRSLRHALRRLSWGPFYWAYLGHCTRALRKGGLLIIKETTNRPRWKSWFTYIEEVLAIRVFKMTKGASPHLESRDTYRSYIEMSGARVYHVQRLDSSRSHPHCLFLARKP